MSSIARYPSAAIRSTAWRTEHVRYAFELYASFMVSLFIPVVSCLSNALWFEMIEQHTPLHGLVVYSNVQRVFEEAGQVTHGTAAAGTMFMGGEAREVDDQRRGENRVAALPSKLHRHFRLQKTLEVDEIPCHLPVIQGLDEIDGNVRRR